jgi:hypothetical protein
MTSRRPSVVLALGAACAPLAMLGAIVGHLAACGSSAKTTDDPPSMLDSSLLPETYEPDRPTLSETYHPDGPCEISVDTPPLLAPQHVAIGSDITWSSNPPSSGPHYPIWAAYRAYTTPVPRGYYLHDEEHGGLVLLYNCAAGPIDCNEIQAKLQQVSDALPDDPLCIQRAQGVRVRVVITPDPLLDVPVAAATWGWTYRAECFDLQSLVDFARAHYGNGREALCDDGQSTF